MNIEVVDIPAGFLLNTRRAKYGAVYAALEALSPGKSLRIAPCPGTHYERGGCGFQSALGYIRTKGETYSLRTVHIGGAIYIFKLLEEAARVGEG